MKVETHWPDANASVGLGEPLIVHMGAGQDQANALVIFVHGLGGDRYGTWGSFPSFLLSDLPSIHVGLYAYRTLVSRLKFSASVELDGEAVVLADTLRDCLTYDRLIMIAHSMGGLLCKAAIKELIDRRDASTLDRLKGLFLLATPQGGSFWAFPFLSWISKDLRALSPHSVLVERVHRTFTDHVTDRTDDVGKVYLPVFAVTASEDAWVSVLSSGLSIPSANRKVVRGSHARIVKPSSPDDDVYQWVLTRVRQLVTNAKRPISHRQNAGDARDREDLTSSELNIPRFVRPLVETQERWKSLERKIAFGRYELLEWIGYGGTGAVFRSRDVALGRQVAVKIFFAVPPQAIASLRQATTRAVRGLASLTHPNVQRMLDHGIHSTSSADSSLFIVSEFIQGKTLQELLTKPLMEKGESPQRSSKSKSVEREKRKLVDNVRLAKQIASGLNAAHSSTFIGESGFQEHGLCHGDMTPKNILIDEAGHVTIIDFMMPDLQRIIMAQEESRHIGSGEDEEYGWRYSNNRYVFRCPMTVAYGTPGFMPPEQSIDGVVTPASDIYTLGLTFGLLFFEGYGPFGLDQPLICTSWKHEEWHFSEIAMERAPSHLRDPFLQIARMIEGMTRLDPNERTEDARAVEAFFVEMEHRLGRTLSQSS